MNYKYRVERFWLSVPPCILNVLNFLYVTDLQPSKAFFGIDVMEAGTVMDKFLHPANAHDPIVLTELGIVTFVRLVHSLKAFLPIDVTVFFNVTFFKDLQLLNRLSGSVFAEYTTSVKDLQNPKLPLIDSTVLLIVTFFNAEQFEKLSVENVLHESVTSVKEVQPANI